MLLTEQFNIFWTISSLKQNKTKVYNLWKIELKSAFPQMATWEWFQKQVTPIERIKHDCSFWTGAIIRLILMSFLSNRNQKWRFTFVTSMQA